MDENLKALEYLQKSLEIKLEIFGENHPEVSKNLKEISLVYATMGNDEEAKKFRENSKKIKRRRKIENGQNIDSKVFKNFETINLKISDAFSKIKKK